MWSPASWGAYPASQQPNYEDPTCTDEHVSKISQLPGIVCPFEIDALIESLSDLLVSDRSFLVHAGDCVELFSSCTPERVLRDASFLVEMGSLVNAPFVIGRICGQFGKPRSSPIEIHEKYGQVPVFRGELINGLCPTDRTSDASRMSTAYGLSRDMLKAVQQHEGRIFTSHDCLLLPYESALVRVSENKQYCTSAHFLWIGDRTRELGGAHVEFCRGIANPIGIKVGASADPAEIAAIVKKLNPNNIAGKITIITRLGSGNVLAKLTPLIAALTGIPVVWQCDPMHGNTIQMKSIKTREVRSIKDEIQDTIITHRLCGSRLHGIHLETTSQDVTECVGGSVGFDDLSKRYASACDPRLNPEQARDVLEFLASVLKGDTFKRATSLSTESKATRESDGVRSSSSLGTASSSSDGDA